MVHILNRIGQNKIAIVKTSPLMERMNGHMVFLFFLFLNAIVLILFWKFGRGSIHSLEVVAYWLFSSIIIHNWSAVIFLNTQLGEDSHLRSMNVIFAINRTFLLPILIVWFLNVVSQVKGVWGRIRTFLFFLAPLLGIGWLSDALGVFHFKKWTFMMSVGAWSITFILSYLFLKLFRKMVRKEGAG